MSKIGRRPIILSTATVDVNEQTVNIKGPLGNFTHVVPGLLKPILADKKLSLGLVKNSKGVNAVWGLHRALLANMIKGVEKGFVLNLKINGLGYKAQIAGNKMVFTLGYSHKIDFEVPKGVTVEVDKTGQSLIVKSNDKFLVGKVCDDIKSLRPVEPYKGTGIIIEGEAVRRKAGKAKSSS